MRTSPASTICWLVSLLAASTFVGCGSADGEEPGYTTSGGGGAGGSGASTSGGGTPSGGAGGSGGIVSGGTGGTTSGGGGSGGVAGGGGTAGSGVGGVGGVGGIGGMAACVPMPACNAPLPTFTKRPWKHTTSSVIAATGFANHRGRDLILAPGMDQWVLGKFAYGVIDKDIHDEEVDIWLDRDCSGTWQKLATGITTYDGDHATVEGVDDTGGRIYYQIPVSQQLGIGRHRIYMVVAGDLSGTEQYIEVVPQGTVYFATDVDGTLTAKENEEYSAILTGTVSDANPDAGKALSLLASKGYRPLYLTARPEFLVGRTREFVSVKGFPLGLVHTTLALGATGGAAVTFKKTELNELTNRGFKVAWAFGNTDSDAEAFFVANIEPADHRVFYQYTDGAYGGRRIESYSELLGEFGALTKPCQ